MKTIHSIDELRDRGEYYLHGAHVIHYGDISFIKTRIRHPQWQNEYQYYFMKEGDVWLIHAGCRKWSSFAEMDTHYDREWLALNSSSYRDPDSHLTSALNIMNRMKFYAEIVGIKL